LGIPNENVHQLRRQKLSIWNIGTKQADIDVVHQNEKDRKTTEQVYAIDTLRGESARCGFRMSHIFIVHHCA
jgi:hypothetical protein